MIGYVYKLTFPNGEIYIGSTKQSVAKRLSSHVSECKSGHGVIGIQRMIEKHGLKGRGLNCTVEQWRYEIDDIDDLRELEYSLINSISASVLLNERVNFDSIKPNDYSTPISTAELAALYGF